MLESYNAAKEMEYQRLSADEQKRRGILGRLVGVIADFKEATRNGRFYSERLWEQFFSNPLTQEKINEKVFVGELGHPADRTEVDPEKIAICLAEMPKKGNDGKIHGVFDILDTPNGRILKTLCDYGSHIGVSSRGTGDVTEDLDGNESVDADTFDCECWDAVLVPAVKDARLSYVTESLNNKKTLKQALKESLESATVEDKQIMTETLKDLDIDIENPEKDVDIDAVSSPEPAAADDDGAPMVEELQKALRENCELKEKIITLQEQLSVGYAKETKLKEQNSQYRDSIIALRGVRKSLQETQDQLKQVQESLTQKDHQLLTLRQSRQHLTESLKQLTNERDNLKQSLEETQSKTQSLQESLNAAKSNDASTVKQLRKETQSLKESLADMQKNSLIKQKEYSAKINSLQEQQKQAITKTQKLVEHYKKVASDATQKYIDMKALHLGISSAELSAKLPKNCSFDDIDTLCESLQQQIVSVSRLPFNLSERKARLTEASGAMERIAKNESADDTVDDSLLTFIQ